MKVDARLDVSTIDEMTTAVRQREVEGYAGLWTSETSHDPFLPLMVAAQHTESIQIGCAVAVAFARNPMTIANLAHDLQMYSCGRFTLGLGTQVKPHIERRFSMPWSHPAERMTEFVLAVRAILNAWETGKPLAFEGKFYSHTLMTPMFTPSAHGYGPPQIIMAGVGERMIEAAGSTADGILLHAFSTPDYIRQCVLPLVSRGLATRGGSREDFEISCRGFLVTGRDERELNMAKEAVRERIAFYGSTPAYRPVLEHHGWGALGEQLHGLSKSSDVDRWTKMAGLVDDDVVNTFAVVAEPDRAGLEITRRYVGVADRFWFYTPYAVTPDVLSSIARSIQSNA